MKFNSSVLCIVIGTFISRVAYFSSFPFLSIFLAKQGISPMIVGIIIASNSISGVITSFINPYIIKKIGEERLIIITAFLWSIVFFGFMTAQEAKEFLILNILNGIFYSLFESVAKLLISQRTLDSQRLIAFNMRVLAINMGAVIGPILGSIWGSEESLHSFAFLAISYIIFGIIMYCFFRGVKKERGDTVQKVYFEEIFSVLTQDKIFLGVVIGALFTYFGYSQLTSTLPQYLAQHSVDGSAIYPILLSINGITILILHYSLLLLTNRMSSFHVILAGNLLITLSLFLIPFSDKSFSLIAAVVIFSIGELLFSSRIDVIIDEIAEKDCKNIYFCISGIMRLGNSIGPIIGGILLGSKITIPFIMFGILALITLLGTFVTYFTSLLFLEK